MNGAGEELGPEADAPSAISRRGLLLGGGVGLGVGAVFGAVGASATRPPSTTETKTAVATTGQRVVARGIHQAGIDRPATPQKNAVVVVADVPADIDRAEVLGLLAALGDSVERVTDGTETSVTPDGPMDLTVTIGIGPRLVSAIDPSLPGADALPAFASDAPLDPALSGGDILIAAYGSDAGALHAAVAHVLAASPTAVRRWSQTGVRGSGEGTIVRNPLGYHDGIIVPQSAADLDANVWIGDGPAAGGTIAVIRRLRLDVARFRSETPDRQDAVIGRRRLDGSPLSGGALTDAVDLRAKTPEGDYLIPVRSHARAAHPSFTGSALMLRRGYAFSNAVRPGAAADDGLLFMCFQNDLESFVRSQRRLDEVDDLMTYTTVTASASFLIVPGRSSDAPLGGSLS
ncbi:MAG: Dyp-type peroxidase [Microbacterium sp.]|jgi:dye decolorizing peroxidase|nr:Dyp-type peroxidase [Microbacterium sp.]